MPTCKTTNTAPKAKTRRGIALVISLIFLVVFSALAVTMFTLSSTNIQVAGNHHKSNTAITAAMSGLECGKYILARTYTFQTERSKISQKDADGVWNNLCAALKTNRFGRIGVLSEKSFTDSTGQGAQVLTGPVNFADSGETFSLRFYRYDDIPGYIYLESTGTDGTVVRKVKIDIQLSKDNQILDYAIAGNNRIWITRDSTIHGPVYSTWDRSEIGPGVKTGKDATVKGRILSADEDKANFKKSNIPGMKVEDYNTAGYKSLCKKIPDTELTKSEYFPHASGDFTQPKYKAGKQYDRKVYENQTFSNVVIPKGTNALFVNCTFEDVLFVETSKEYCDSPTTTNNIRFQDCRFNGTIVSDVPRTSNHYSWWMRNVLYFTGTAEFDNQSLFPETTILAPNFNVNIGNTGKLDDGVENILTGAIIGGIVDIRGEAKIEGSVISMYDASRHDKGYITNIGAADDDGTEGEDYYGGKIEITPDPARGLPDGIKSVIVINPLDKTYSELL